MVRKGIQIIIKLILLFSIIGAINFFLNSGESEKSKPLIVHPKSLLKSENKIANSFKKILIWNSYWGQSAIWHKIFGQIVNGECFSKCILTLNKNALKSADAVLFHLIDLPNEDYNFPIKDRNPEQIWIGMSYEPPFVMKSAGLNFSRLNGIFNRTMSYRQDADIVVRHGDFYKIKDYQTHLSPINYIDNWINSRDSIKDRNYAFGKRRLIAWFVSSHNCKSESGRELYVKDLEEFIPVDIYGVCGSYKCGKSKTLIYPYRVEDDDCYYLVSKAYKFVLSFENSLCNDYVTEKLYNNFKLNVIPIVFGASNYSKYAPPNSIINANEFSPKELASYLYLLDSNDTLYNEYFKWKENYFIKAQDGVPLSCDLCEKISNENWRKEKNVYENMESWLEKGCFEGYKSLNLNMKDEDLGLGSNENELYQFLF